MANPDYYLANKERVRLKSREYYAKNKERMLEKKRKASSEFYNSNKGDLDFRLRQLVRGAKQRAKLQGLDFDIDFEYVKELWSITNGKCQVSGREFDLTPSDTYQNKDAPSLDKIEPKLGYIKGNVRLVTWHVNAAILNFGLDTFLDLCRNVIENTKETNEQKAS